MSAPVENPGGEVRVYEAADGEVRVDVRLDRETVWLTQEQMSQLFGRERSVAPSTSGTCFGRGSWNLGQHVQNLHMFKTEGDRTVTRDVDPYNAMSSSPSATASSPSKAGASANGLPPRIW